jgi:hypothetical protein
MDDRDSAAREWEIPPETPILHSLVEGVDLPLANATDELLARLDGLRARGADAFDPPAFRFLEALAARLSTLDGGARARVEARLAARIDELAHAMIGARADAERRIAAARARGEPPAEVDEAFRRGDYRGAARAAARWERERSRTTSTAIVLWTERVVARARAHAERLPGALAGRLAELVDSSAAPDPSTARALANAVSRALFREAAEAVQAEIAVARATDNLPAESGPYNAHFLAARALQRLARLSPRYLRAYLASLAELAALEAALAPTKPVKERKRPPRKKRAEA